jgi:hypothetical protein
MKLVKPIILFIFFFSIIFKTYSQNIFVVNSQAVNLRLKPSAKSTIVGKANFKDTLYLIAETGDWINVYLKNGQQGFLLKKFTTPVSLVKIVSEIQPMQIDMSRWNFSFLFSATFKYFLLITIIILLVLLLIYYFK